MTADTNIIEKIRKLLALAERGGTEAEAESAMLKVQEMLTRHNLTIDAIRKSDEVTIERDYKEYPWNQSWIRQVYSGIASLYFCKFYYEQHGTNVQRCFLIGEPVNIQTCQYVCDMIIATGNRLAKEYATASRLEYIEHGGSDKDAIGIAISASNGFKKGFGLRIRARAEAMVREASTKDEVAGGAGQALVVADFYKRNQLALDKAASDKFRLRLSNGAGMKFGNASHMGAGSKAAESVNLRTTGIGAQSGSKLIGN